MKFERFSQLWDALVTGRPKSGDVPPISNGMRDETAEALVAYSKGDKGKIEEVKKFLASNKQPA